ncbi:hypothetical protein D5086_028928 [Populus alba]|uniref:Uncharacterized protein n=1 Tax=Populus alba TaxID=43335 RepID=A0ACC4AS06_POPAL
MGTTHQIVQAKQVALHGWGLAKRSCEISIFQDIANTSFSLPACPIQKSKINIPFLTYKPVFNASITSNYRQARFLSFNVHFRSGKGAGNWVERSKKKFIWVLRDGDKGDVFNGEERRTELPKGYENSVDGFRTSEGDEMRKESSRNGGVRARIRGEGGVSRMEMESFIAHITRKNSIKYKYGHRKQSLFAVPLRN